MKRTIHSQIVLVAAAIAVTLSTAATAVASEARPNVILVMTDDQGYGDLSCHGNPILKTPNLDRLHAESVRFTDFHASPFCTPTRAALMTGRYPGRTGAYRTSSGRTMLHTDEKTVANVFADAGYATGMVGKWHLGDNAPHRPQDRGFQDVVWHRCGGVGQASDYWGNDYFDDTYERNGKFEKFDGYCTDVWFAEGIRFIEKNQDKTFFLYLATNAPHGPYRVDPKWAAPYQGKANWGQGANFYGMIANFDHNLGLLRGRLEELGLSKNTILVFMTDNGTSNGAAFGKDKLNSEAIDGFNAGMRGKKSSIYEGGHRVPFFIHWPGGGLTGGRDINTLAAHIDVLPTLADLCGAPVPPPHRPDGRSLAPLLKNADAAWDREHLMVQYHGGAHFRHAPEAWTDSVVLTERWRLLQGGELYDIQADPAQRKDIASEFPEVVARLREYYSPYWESVSPRLRPVRIDLGNPNHNPTVLCSQDWHMPTGNPPWNFGTIRKLPRTTGPWMVDVKKAGSYRITLRQLPAEADAIVEGVRARVSIANQEKELPVKPGSKGVVFEMELPAGPTELVTWLYDEKGRAGGAYFTEVEALERKATSAAAEIHVGPAGKDTNPGTVAAPLKTLAAARDAARASAGKEPITVHVADGVYYLPETLVFTPADSGSEKNPVTYRAVNEGRAILSGGLKLDLKWKPHRNGIFQASTPAGLEIDQLFIDGIRQRMARYPNYDADQKTAAYQGYAADAFSKERAAGWANPAGGYIHAMHRSRWGGYHYRITGKTPDGEIAYEGGWQNNRQMGMHKEFRMVENIFEELDAPGEWFHEPKNHTLYYKPDPDTDLSRANVEIVRLRHLVEFQGSEEAPVRFITLQGFVVRHAARTFMDTREPMLRSDWAIYRGGAFLLTGTEDVGILDTEFDQVGGNAIFVNNYNRRTLVKGCHIHDVGASGVCFVGDPESVRDPLFEYNEKNDLSKIDRTPGPKTNNYPASSTVEDCLIHGIGRVERQPAGVMIEMATEITVRDCSVYDCARSGINIGDGCWGGHLIERCDVFDTVLETHDHGSFNSWGRDRFWHSDRGVTQVAVDMDPELPFLDALKTTVIRDSRWRCDHGWDIDLDDGSSNYDIYNNLMLQGGLKLREGFRRRAWNNITVNNGFHPHVWYNHSGDEVFGNIFMHSHKGARMPSDTAKGKRVDGNLFFSADPKIKDRFTQFGWDVNSIAADPLFVDPAAGDFRVRKGSPAFEIGFENFPMDQFGVKKPSLKAIAQTPVIPELERGEKAPSSTKVPVKKAPTDAYWLGAKLHALQGEEFSAYGVSKEEAGIALSEVPKNSEAARAGLRENDLIQGLNGHAIANLAQFHAVLLEIGAAPMKAKVVRNQQATELALTDCPWLEVETSPTADGFEELPPPSPSGGVITANQRTNNEPLATLTDGRLARNYGPIFGNRIRNGAYKMDLGSSRPVAAIASWSFNQNGKRGAQKVTLFGSNSAVDPGWNLTDRERFTPIGSLDTSDLSAEPFTVVSLQARSGRPLGTYRWIVWSLAPVTKLGENTAFQELSVEIRE